MTYQIPVNASTFSAYMDMSVEEIKFLPFYGELVDIHSSYAAGTKTDTEYAAAMDSIIADHSDYAENLGHLKARLLAHI